MLDAGSSLKRALRSLWVVASLLATPAGAVVVTYAATDVADTVSGEDRWRVRYVLDEFPFDAGYGFTVYFDPDLYADLVASPAHPNADWDAITVEPDPDLGADGLYDAEALADAPAIDVSFVVTFRWLGAGVPGAQPFEVRDPSLATVDGEVGTTVLPEPAPLAASAAALASLATRRRSAV